MFNAVNLVKLYTLHIENQQQQKKSKQINESNKMIILCIIRTSTISFES